MSKPRIRFLSGKYGGYWVCVQYGLAGRGKTPVECYRDLFKRLREMAAKERWT